MSAQHTPGPWYPVKVVVETGSRWLVQRVVSREPRRHEFLRDEQSGHAAVRFRSESEAARAAIAMSDEGKP